MLFLQFSLVLIDIIIAQVDMPCHVCVSVSPQKTVFFEDLTSEKARSYFNDFVKLWNKGKLDEVCVWP